MSKIILAGCPLRLIKSSYFQQGDPKAFNTASRVSKIVIRLECGHKIVIQPATPSQITSLTEGKRTRCEECKDETPA